ncbi:MAG: hypothetical protein V1749_00420 [Candidatus Desantisbacteria bacterium]
MRISWIILIILCLSRVALTAEIQVVPGKLLITDVPVGRQYEVSVPLTIINYGQDEQRYVLSTIKPSTMGADIETGYIEIPDEHWFYFATETTTIKPGDFGQVRMYINIPNEEGYYNQHWVVGFRVATDSGTQSSFALALYPKYWIETEAKPEIKGKARMGIARLWWYLIRR